MKSTLELKRIRKAIVFTDIVNSTSMKALVGGDAHYFRRILYPHYESVRNHLEKHRGIEIKTTGDGFLLCFDTAQSAVEYAIKLQSSLKAFVKDISVPLKIRIGIHWGEVFLHELEADVEITGANVDYASRICDAANPGQVILSEAASAKVELKGFRLIEWKGYVLKGFEGIHSIFQVTWDKVEATRPEGKTLRICDKLLKILRPASDPEANKPLYITLRYHSRKLNETWVYQVLAETKCGELTGALAEQHFAPFHSTFGWILVNDANRPCDRNISLTEAGLHDNCTIGMIMKSMAPILDIAYDGPESMYVSHELKCMGDFERAVHDYEKIAKKEPGNVNVLNRLAWVYLEVNSPVSKPEELVRKCLTLDPSIMNKPYFRDTMGWLEYRKRNFKAAEEHLLFALEGTDRRESEYDYVCILHHLYFVWRALGKNVIAELARSELALVLSSSAVIRLFLKRTGIDDDTFLMPKVPYLSMEWNKALWYTTTRPHKEYSP